MKLKYTISFILVTTALLYLFAGTSPATNNTESSFSTPVPGTGDNFILGAFQDGYDLVFNNYADTLGFNIWHMYNGSRKWGGRTYPDGWTNPSFAPADSLFADSSNYIGQVQTVMNGINNHGKKALLMRPKVEWLCFGQRSDYQCEDVSGDLWFYSFNTRETGEQTTDSGQGVIHCRAQGDGPNYDAPGIVVKNLRANSEQCNAGWEFHGDSECDWLIKPRIRIDSNFAHNYPTTPVCSITVKNQAGSIIKNVILKGRNFLVDGDPPQFYNGRYLEEFSIFLGDDSLKIHGNWGDGWMYSARGYNNTAGADVQVYWYGNCDMWIDYVRVDNDVANDLFKGIYDNTWLRWEAQNIACHLDGAASYNFYIELFEFNNIPCMSYVSRKLDTLAYSYCGKHISLLCIPIPTFYSAHVPWDYRLSVQNINHFRDNFLNKVGASEFLLGFYPFNSSYHYPEQYPNYDTWTRIPNTLPRYDTLGTLAVAVAPNVYVTWLQDYLDEKPYSFEAGYTGGFRSPCEEDPGGFRYTMQFGDAVSKATGKAVIVSVRIILLLCL